MIQRREFLQAMLLATGAGMLGCQSQPEWSQLKIPGRIVGANFATGHLLRDRLPNRPPSRSTSVEVAILGGGISGLSAAWRLIRAGVDDVHLFELENDLGGNSRCQRYPESSAPWAAHYLPVPTRESTAVTRLLVELGLRTGTGPLGQPIYDLRAICHDPEERLYAYGAWEEGLYPRTGASTEDFQQLDAFHADMKRWQDWRDSKGRKAFAIPIELSSDAPEMQALDRLTFAQYLNDKGWTSKRLRWYAEYGCRDDYGTTLVNTSAWAGLHHFASRDGGGFEPKGIEFVWPEGNGFLTRHFAGLLGPRQTTGQLVCRVVREPKQVVIHLLDAVTHEITEVKARRCLYALPSFLRPYLMGEPRSDFSYAPWVVINVVLDKEPPNPGRPRFPLAWDNVIYGSPSLGYVYDNHQDIRLGDRPTVLTWYYPYVGDDPRQEREVILRHSWEDWKNLCLAELEMVHPGISELVRRLDVMLWGHAMIRPTPGFRSSPDRLRLSAAQPPLWFAHSDLSGISIFEQANYQGVRAAQAILRDLGHPAEDWLRG